MEPNSTSTFRQMPGWWTVPWHRTKDVNRGGTNLTPSHLIESTINCVWTGENSRSRLQGRIRACLIKIACAEHEDFEHERIHKDYRKSKGWASHDGPKKLQWSLEMPCIGPSKKLLSLGRTGRKPSTLQRLSSRGLQTIWSGVFHNINTCCSWALFLWDGHMECQCALLC